MQDNHTGEPASPAGHPVLEAPDALAAAGSAGSEESQGNGQSDFSALDAFADSAVDRVDKFFIAMRAS